MPDYHLYDQWVESQISSGKKSKDFEYYTSFSIGYLTRRCFRGCQFCVNRNYKQVIAASSFSEFYDPSRPYICLLDDNFFGYPNWKELIKPIKVTGKQFEFKQGLDERLLTDDKCAEMATWRYKGDMIFAFDNIEDSELIIQKAAMWRKYSKKNTKFYCFCGFDRNGQYTQEFWKQDILNVFARCRILSKYQCLPYIMRHEYYNNSPYRGMYVTLARWANQPAFFKRKTFREFCEACNQTGSSSALRYMNEFEPLLTEEEKHNTIDYYFGWK